MQRERVITAIEIISPINRLRPDGRAAYKNNRRYYVEAGVNVVELDFLRAGEHLIGVEEDEIPAKSRAAFYACIWRVAGSQWELYPLPLRHRLPDVRVPLRCEDKDAVLPLQAMIDKAYERGSYDRILRHQRPPSPPLPPEDAAWAEELLRAAGKLSEPEALK